MLDCGMRSTRLLRTTSVGAVAVLVTADLLAVTLASLAEAAPSGPLGAPDAPCVPEPDPPSPQDVDRPAVYRSGTWYLRDSFTSGPATSCFVLGNPTGDIPVTGDWDGDGTRTAGVFRSATATWYLRNSNSQGGADIVVHYGNPGDNPVVGDWDGNGTDTVGVTRVTPGNPRDTG